MLDTFTSGNIQPPYPTVTQGSYVESYQVYHITGKLWIASLCLLIYDIFLTLDMEVKYFWNARPGFWGCVFFLNRYWPAVNLIVHNTILCWDSPSPSLCTAWFQYTGYSTSLEHLVVGAILIIRVYAIFNRNKRLLVALLILCAFYITAEIIIIGLSTHEFHDTTFGSTGCVPIDIPRWCWTYWVPALTFDSTLFLLSLLKTIHVSRDPVQQSSLLSVLLRDSFLYYGGVMMVALANFMAWYIKPIPFYGTFIACFISSQSILGCRLLLNIRESAENTTCSEYQHAVVSVPEWNGILTTVLDESYCV